MRQKVGTRRKLCARKNRLCGTLRNTIRIHLVQQAGFPHNKWGADKLRLTVAIKLDIENPVSRADHRLIRYLVSQAKPWSKRFLTQNAKGFFADSQLLCRLDQWPIGA